MTEMTTPAAELVAAFVETIGIAIIGAASLFVVLLFVLRVLQRHLFRDAFDEVRLLLGRGILLGLEFLMAADIVHTVAVELTFETVGVLSIIVLIRTFLSTMLELELNGHWPWQKSSAKS